MTNQTISLKQIVAEVTDIESILEADKDGSRASVMEDYLHSLAQKFEEARVKLTDYEQQTHASLLRDAFAAGARTVSAASDKLR